MITKWLRKSGLIVNEAKTEICLFHKNDQPLITINFLNTQIKSKKEMNVLGVVFDCKLNWNAHIAKTISKAKKSLFALRLLKKYFSPDEMKILLDSKFYSILYYNAVIWLTPSISAAMKQSLMSISANALRSCTPINFDEISFERIHLLCKKSTPKQIMLYQAALKLYKILEDLDEKCTFEHVTVISNIVSTSRQTTFEILRDNSSKIGLNTTSNKLYHINKQISLLALSYSFVHFKKLMKIQFLKYGKT